MKMIDGKPTVWRVPPSPAKAIDGPEVLKDGVDEDGDQGADSHHPRCAEGNLSLDMVGDNAIDGGKQKGLRWLTLQARAGTFCGARSGAHRTR